MADNYGYRRGARVAVSFPIDSTSADISVGDLIYVTAGYAFQAAAGDRPIGVAMQTVNNPAADGEAYVLVDVSSETVYEYPPDTGTVTAALVGKSMDVGGARSIDIDASADDCVFCVGVDVSRNTLLVQLNTKLGFVGVV